MGHLDRIVRLALEGEMASRTVELVDQAGDPVTFPDASTLVLRAPTTLDRNLIQPTADAVNGLIVRSHSLTQNAPLFEAQSSDGNPILSVVDSQGTGRQAVLVQGPTVNRGSLVIYSAYGQVVANNAGRYLDVFQVDDNGLPVSGFSVMCKGGIVPSSKGVNILLWGKSSTDFEGTGAIIGDFLDDTDASYKGRMILMAEDFNADREFLRGEADGTAPRLGLLGATAAVRQTGGAATAGGTYTATEQGMLQKAYDCLRTFGLLT